jgi:glyoxylase-like metal-dependent hydrolase (beta-lactamase superfamily II)
VPHGTVRAGDIKVTALCDVVGHYPRPFAQAFPTIPPERHDEFRARYPEAFDGPDAWMLHAHCYLVRAGSTTLLVDTGVGDVGTMGAEWIHSSGGLPGELEGAGVAAAAIDVVAITHAHLDHIGWSVIRHGSEVEPMFPNARYAIQRAEWEGFTLTGDEDDRMAFDQSLAPLQALGVLGLADGEERLTEGVTLHLAPGHTPGHQVVLLESRGERAVLSGDLANHPAQVTEPSWRSRGDRDPDTAAITRTQWLDAVERWNALLCTAHFPQPFGHLARGDGGRFWRPEAPVDTVRPPRGDTEAAMPWMGVDGSGNRGNPG